MSYIDSDRDVPVVQGNERDHKVGAVRPFAVVAVLASLGFVTYLAKTTDGDSPSARAAIEACAIKNATGAKENGVVIDILPVGAIVSSFVAGCDLDPDGSPHHSVESDFYAAIAAKVQAEV